jgi:hypothetical protein
MQQVIVCDTNAMPFEEVRRGRVHMIRRKRLPLETGVPGPNEGTASCSLPGSHRT